MNASRNFATRRKKARIWARPPFDWYVEPTWATAALLSRETFDDLVWDPACGGGNVPGALISAGVPAIGTDIVDRGLASTLDHGWAGPFDFLHDDGWLPGARHVVTNPPFYRAKGTEAFARKALRHATGIVAVFADVKFQAGGARGRGFFADHPPTRVWVLADRPSCPPGEYLQAGNVARGGTADWCWLVWDLAHPERRDHGRILRPAQAALAQPHPLFAEAAE